MYSLLSRTRLEWYAGYISEGVRLLDDVKTVSVSSDGLEITVQEHEGEGGRFTRTMPLNGEGDIVFNEVPLRQIATQPPPPPSPPRVPTNETFDYSVRIPSKGHDARCIARTDKSGRLVGASPQLRFDSVGILQGGGPLSRWCQHITRPAVCGTRVTLVADFGDNAPVSAASFHLDETLVNALREGDELNLTRTPRGALGLSVLRQGALLMALGAVSALPLGSDLKVVVRRDRLSKDQPAPGSTDKHLPWLHPLEITSGDPPRRPRGFSISVWYRAWPAPHDADECVTIVRTGACPAAAAAASTHLLAMDGALRLRR